jgi:glycosyltransferase involved in cell wall biosynthesis
MNVNQPKVLLLGVGYFPSIISGDKNFFFRLVPIIARSTDELLIVSVNDQQGQTNQKINGRTVPIYNVRRPLHRGSADCYYAPSGELLDYRHTHGPVREALEKQAAVVASLPTLGEAIRGRDVRIVHFMDNCGLAMPLVKRVFPQVRVSCSAPNYNQRPLPYRLYLKYSLGMLDRVVPYTEAYREKLQSIGVPASRLHLIRWGVPSRQKTLSQREKEQVRASLGIAASSTLFVWSGYVQQVQEEDFFKTLEIARQLVRQQQRTEFIFAFKPLSYKDAYEQYGEKGITILSRITNFLDLLDTADFLLSPISAVNSTVSPPLTWLEAMSLGTPVITTDVPGVRELVTHAETGYVAESFDRLPGVIQQARHDVHRAEVSQAARDIVKRKHNIEDCAAEYVDMWRGMARE